MYINFTYKVTYKPQPDYKFEEYDDKIGVSDYKEPLMKEMEFVLDKLREYEDSTQAVAVLFNQNFQSCLLNVQFQIQKGILYVTANYRSQAAVYRERDEKMLSYLADQIMKHFGQMKVDITCNVGNYHILSRK